jgi:hypothetical protein
LLDWGWEKGSEVLPIFWFQNIQLPLTRSYKYSIGIVPALFEVSSKRAAATPLEGKFGQGDASFANS